MEQGDEAVEDEKEPLDQSKGRQKETQRGRHVQREVISLKFAVNYFLQSFSTQHSDLLLFQSSACW